MNSSPTTKHHHLFQTLTLVFLVFLYLPSLWSYNNKCFVADYYNEYTLSPPQVVVVKTLAGNTSKQIQISHATSMNRYPQEYTAAKDYFDKSKSTSTTTTTTAAEEESRILSFGSSTGEEAITLATLYFNKTQQQHSQMKIIGIDIDEPTIKKAEENVRQHSPPILPESKIEFYNGRDLNNSYTIDRKPYDIIFANSVLCYHNGPNMTLDDIVTKFPFGDYESTLLTLDESLKVGGILAMVNMNYNFEDTSLAGRYNVVSTCNGNFVQRVELNTGTLITPNRFDQMDCLWVKMRNA